MSDQNVSSEPKNNSSSQKTNLYTRHRQKRSKESTFNRAFGFLNKVPWEKISIWTIFLFLLWTLRDFFTLILLTFVFTYIANTIVRFLSERFEVERRPLTFTLYILLLGIFLGPGHWFANRVIEQGQNVAQEADKFIPELKKGKQQNNETSPGQEKKNNRHSEEENSTPSDSSTPSSPNETNGNGSDDTDQNKTEDSNKPHGPSSEQPPRQMPPSKEELSEMFEEGDMPEAENMTWKMRFLQHKVSMLKKEVEKLQKQANSSTKDKTTSIQRAENVPDDIREWVDGILSDNLGPEWMSWVQKRGLYDYLLVKVNQVWEKGKQHLPDISGRVLISTGNFLFTVLLAFLFSFFIVFDIPKLQKRLSEFKSGRLSDFYNEIAPSLANFGIVMGRSLQAQAMIAIVNTVLTVSGIYLMSRISVDFRPYLAVLTIIVFLCSFIPVLGVIISTIPIGLIALVHGGLGHLIAVIVLILAIHGLETYVLNPNIYGAHMRMHPLIVLIVLLVAEHFFGVWGLILGVPISVYLLDIVIQQTSPEELFYEPQSE